MKGRKIIIRILITTFWLGMVALLWIFLTASVNSRQSDTVKDFKINITGGLAGQWFLEEQDIINLAGIKNKTSLLELNLKELNLEALENKLLEDPWIKNAEVYVDNKMVLHLNVQERKPVARIFHRGGQSFYLGEEAVVLPMTKKSGARLPVFTGYSGNIKKPSVTDSTLLKDILTMGNFLLKNEFWGAQVQQAIIKERSNFELIPLVGNHTIEFGTIEGYEDKFKRLLIFYKHVLPKTGFEKYKIIKAQYEGQIVGVK